MFLQCGSLDWVLINEQNSMLIRDYNEGWAAMYGSSSIGPRVGGSRGSGPDASPPTSGAVSTGTWARCGASTADFAISFAGDAAFFTGAGVAITGLRAYALGRAGQAAVRSRAVRTGRGALLRQSAVLINGGSTMVGVGAGGAALGWAAGVENDVYRAVGTGDFRWATIIPLVGTAMALVDAAQACYAAVSGSF